DLAHVLVERIPRRPPAAIERPRARMIDRRPRSRALRRRDVRERLGMHRRWIAAFALRRRRLLAHPRRKPSLERARIQGRAQLVDLGEVRPPRVLLIEDAELLVREPHAREALHAAFTVEAQRQVRALLAV